MSELTEILKKVNLENLMPYLIYGTDSSREIFDNYEEKIESSFDELFEKLESLYENADREDNRLFDAIGDFALIHDDVYFEAGFLTGVQLSKCLEQSYKKHGAGDIESILKKSNHLKREDTQKTVMQQFIQNRMDHTLEETLKADKTYQKASGENHRKINEMNRDKFTHEQWKLIDDTLSGYNQMSYEYGRVAYEQGLVDTLNFLKDILLKTL